MNHHCRFALIWLLPLCVFAHPHIFVDVSARYDVDRQRLYMQWLIDDASSELIKLDHDTNRNNHFEPQEAKAMLDQEGYAMFFYQGDFFLHPKRTVEHLEAAIVDGRVRITFETSAPPGTIDIWDEASLFSFHVNEISGMTHRQESEGYFGCRFELGTRTQNPSDAP